MTIDVTFFDHGVYAKEKPNPNYPNGKPITLEAPAIAKTCTRNLPYPAPRCGLYEVHCRTCGFRAMITVAGRTDDPNIITMPCKPKGLN